MTKSNESNKKAESTANRLEIVYLPADALVKLKGNPRREKDPKALVKLARLITAHGFQNPLQVYAEHGKYIILAGNHRFDAGISLGMTEFPCLIYAGDRKSALARAISDNKSNEWTEWDMPVLREFFIEFDTGDIDIHLTGFDTHEIELMMTAVHPDAPEQPGSMFRNFNEGKGVDSGTAHEELPPGKYPVTFIFDQEEWELWEGIKARLKLKDDKAAFLKLIGRKSNA